MTKHCGKKVVFYIVFAFSFGLAAMEGGVDVPAPQNIVLSKEQIENVCSLFDELNAIVPFDRTLSGKSLAELLRAIKKTSQFVAARARDLLIGEFLEVEIPNKIVQEHVRGLVLTEELRTKLATHIQALDTRSKRYAHAATAGLITALATGYSFCTDDIILPTTFALILSLWAQRALSSSDGPTGDPGKERYERAQAIIEEIRSILSGKTSDEK